MLTHLMAIEVEEDIDQRKEQFKLDMMAANPAHMDTIVRMFNGEEEDKPLTEEELDEATPLSGEQITEAMGAMKSLGFAMIDD